MTLEEEFAYLFRGRTDAYGLLHGECVRLPVTIDDYRNHLFVSDYSLGIYPLIPGEDPVTGEPRGNWVAWGCTDIDNKQDPESTLVQAKNLQRALKLLGLTAWIERSKSKGHHVWVFVDGWVGATEMRHALLFAHQVAGVAPTEVNPKQVEGVELGNYVNLPYPYGWASERPWRRCIVNDDAVWAPSVFVESAQSSLNSPESVRQVGARYSPPPKPQRLRLDAPYLNETTLPRCTPLIRKIVDEGPLENADRSTTLAKLAHLLAETDLTPNEALAVLTVADYRWGKFYDRADGEYQLQKLIENAWSRRG